MSDDPLLFASVGAAISGAVVFALWQIDKRHRAESNDLIARIERQSREQTRAVKYQHAQERLSVAAEHAGDPKERTAMRICCPKCNGIWAVGIVEELPRSSAE